MADKINQTLTWNADVDDIAEGLELAAQQSATVVGAAISLFPMSQDAVTGQYRYHLQITGQTVSLDEPTQESS